ncbi:MAG: hypothetical protein KC422_09555 [Trueperaceae bacterium]|nr:hypothetical protein [Trueperaceae bacterium]
MKKIVFLLISVFSLFAFAQESEEFRSPGTASYYLAPVEASGIDGTMQVTEQIDMGSRIVVSLSGIDTGQNYDLELYEGNCGPDRVLVTELEPVGEFSNDPYVSLNDTELDFTQLTEGDYFLYVLQDNKILACGEVGLGANASTN